MLLAKYKFMPEALMLPYFALHNSRGFAWLITEHQCIQGVKQCFANSIAIAYSIETFTAVGFRCLILYSPKGIQERRNILQHGDRRCCWRNISIRAFPYFSVFPSAPLRTGCLHPSSFCLLPLNSARFPNQRVLQNLGALHPNLLGLLLLALQLEGRSPPVILPLSD